MRFSEFANRIYKVIGGREKKATFVRTLFECMVGVEYRDVVRIDKSDSTYNSYMNGGNDITGIAKDISPYINSFAFEDYLYEMNGNQLELLAKGFQDTTTRELNSVNVIEYLADFFADIIIEAAGRSRTTANKNEDLGYNAPPSEDYLISDYFDEADAYGKYLSEVDFANITEYLDKAYSHYEKVKTLLYSEDPKPFYDFYVCNSLTFVGTNNPAIDNVTVETLTSINPFTIISGTGGIGKSMMLRHLFLTNAALYKDNPKDVQIPVLIFLKNYTDMDIPLHLHAFNTICEFRDVRMESYMKLLEEGNFVFLLDGLDEVGESISTSFERNLDNMIKKYGNNSYVISSRPSSSFISLNRFKHLSISPFTKDQALKLIDILDYRDKDAKGNFRKALDNNLYHSHIQFASNPLLLTIMLMTYSYFGEIPAKMHVFYEMAYKTMSRLHDATKGAYKRPLHTNLSPEDFAEFFSTFCAKSYLDQQLSFTQDSFCKLMEEVIKHSRITTEAEPIAFLKDLTDNLCLMYQEGHVYHFIHRSFQEYFAAYFFIRRADRNFPKIAEKLTCEATNSFTDMTIPFMYEMSPAKMDEFVFIPLLKKLLAHCDALNGYETFLMDMYLEFRVGSGLYTDTVENMGGDSLYEFYIHGRLNEHLDLSDMNVPEDADDFIDEKYVYIHEIFLDSDGVSFSYGDEMMMINYDRVPYGYEDIFGKPEVAGCTYEIITPRIYEQRFRYQALIDWLESPDFPLMAEYTKIRQIVADYDAATSKRDDSDDFFDLY